MIETWEDSIRGLDAVFREDGKTVERGPDAPFMVLQETFLKHARQFLEYVKDTMLAVSADKKGKIEEVVMHTTKWNFLLHHASLDMKNTIKLVSR